MAANRLLVAARASTNTTFALSAASQATAAFGAQTYLIRVATNATAAYIKIGDGTPTATTSDMVMGANMESYFIVTPGQKLAVLGKAATDQLSVTEMI
jgi:hypothetical protein